MTDKMKFECFSGAVFLLKLHNRIKWKGTQFKEKIAAKDLLTF